MDIKYDPIRSEHLVQIGFVLKEYMLVENLPEASKLIEIFGRVNITTLFDFFRIRFFRLFATHSPFAIQTCKRQESDSI